jgi:BCD family chlorophyll transporter-like MFS transporter
MVLFINGFGMWKQEPRRASTMNVPVPMRPDMRAAWAAFRAEHQSIRRLVTIGLGTMALSMQDILLEPYGGQILHMTVGQTTQLTAALAGGGLTGLALRRPAPGPRRRPITASPPPGCSPGSWPSPRSSSPPLWPIRQCSPAGVFLIGLASGLFLVGTLSDAMGRAAKTA